MDLFDAIRARRTANGPLDPRPVDPAHVRQILEMAACAPSHFNSQPWRFIVVQDEKIRHQIAEIAGESMRKLMDERYPVYALADVTVPTRDEKKELIAAEVVAALERFLPAASAAAEGAMP